MAPYPRFSGYGTEHCIEKLFFLSREWQFNGNSYLQYYPGILLGPLELSLYFLVIFHTYYIHLSMIFQICYLFNLRKEINLRPVILYEKFELELSSLYLMHFNTNNFRFCE